MRDPYRFRDPEFGAREDYLTGKGKIHPVARRNEDRFDRCSRAQAKSDLFVFPVSIKAISASLFGR